MNFKILTLILVFIIVSGVSILASVPLVTMDKPMTGTDIALNHMGCKMAKLETTYTFNSEEKIVLVQCREKTEIESLEHQLDMLNKMREHLKNLKKEYNL